MMMRLKSNVLGLKTYYLFVLAIVAIIIGFTACTTNHYFSVSAEEMSNPRIEYKDSTNVTNPF